MAVERKRYQIEVAGCDDTTYFPFDLSEREYEVVEQLAAASREASAYGCQPVIFVTDQLRETGDEATDA